MKTHAKDSDEHNALDIKQNVLKVIANSIYGSLGAIKQYGRLSNRMLARLVTLIGREMLELLRDCFLSFPGVTIVAGDTDSVMARIHNVTLKEAVAFGEEVTELRWLIHIARGNKQWWPVSPASSLPRHQSTEHR